MKLKPKSTVKNPRALVYKRFIGLERSMNLATIYKTVEDQKYWTFNSDVQAFSEIETTLIPQTSVIKEITSQTIVTYLNKYYKYASISIPGFPSFWAWLPITNLPENSPLLSATFNNIGKYQTNKYFFSGSFDYMIKGSIEGTTSQFIKGNIIPLTSLNIKYYNDSINLSVDDLVVIGNKIYSVENPETIQKMQPKPFKIYSATLNAIL